MPFNRCSTPAEAIAQIEGILRQGGDGLVLVFGSEDPATGASWCPDCVTADPVLRRTLHQQRPDLIVHECPVGQRSDWKGRADHPFRQHPAFRIERIPTLIRISAGREAGRLVEGDCADPVRVTAFIS